MNNILKLPLTGAIWTLAAISASGEGLQYDGVDDYVTMGAAPGLGSETFTVETWFRRTGAGLAANSGTGGVVGIPLVTKGRGEGDNSNLDMNYFLGIHELDGVLVADFEEGANGSSPGLNHPVVGVTVITNDVWHHAAVTYDGAKWQLFLDGGLEVELVIGQPPRADSIQHAALGSALNSSGTPVGAFAGQLDEVRIWNYARSASQISNNYQAEIPSAPGLVGRWALDETSGLTASDSSGSSIDGNLTNGPVWSAGYSFPPLPAVTLTAPADQSVEPDPNMTFTCDTQDASGLASATLYVGLAGNPLSFLPVETKTISGTSTTVSFTTALQDGQNYVWNCLVVNVSGGQRWAAADFGLLVDGNYPGFPVLISPLVGAVDVPVPPSLQVQVNDPNSDALTVSFYGRDTQPADFTVAVIPDTQYYVSGLNGGSPQIFIDQMNWIVASQATSNIAFVTHLGDIVQNGDLVQAEWYNASDAMYSLEYPSPSLPEGIPYGLAAGNHDQTPVNDPDGTTIFFNQYFGEAHFAGRSYYGGHYGSNNDNNYQLFSASGIDFIIVHLEHDPAANPTVLAWADGLLQTHSDRRAIVVTHHLVGTGNPATFGAQGQAIYDALKGNPNLILMMGGHVSGEGRRQDTFNGNTVHSLLADYQNRVNGGDGWMRILEFSPANDEIRVKTYSPTLNQFETDADSEFTLTIPLDPGFKLIGENGNVPSGSSTSVFWSDAEVDSDYEWYVAVTDPTNRRTQGNLWSFDTSTFDSNPPVISGISTINITDQAAEIIWTTDEISTSEVEFGLDPFYGSLESNGNLVASHSLTLTNLAIGQTYHFRVRSSDFAGNVTLGPDMTLTTATVDLTPPAPSPLTWASIPASAGIGSITMTATTASDPSAVEYYFENLTDPGHDSGWQVSPIFTDTQLLPDTSYIYQVKARDLSAANNETGYSSQASATTGAGSATVLRGPYLQNGKPDGISIMWRTDNFTNGRIWYGDSPTNMTQVVDEPTPPPPLIARGANWSYLDTGVSQGTAWKEVAFDDSGWAQGSAQLGYGDGDEATVVSFGSDANNKRTTTYFRHTFTVTGAAGITALELGLKRDDGAVIYLNGSEIRRDNMPGGAISYSTFASSAIGSPAEETFFVTTLDPALLAEGSNVLAVEIHQANLTSSDISLDLDLYIPQPGGGGDGFDHLVRLSGLNPDSTYYYQVGTAQGEVLAGADTEHYFKTLPVPGSSQPVRIWALGDSGTADNNARAVRDAYLELATVERPADLLLMLGDNAYTTGTDAEYQDAIFENMYEDILRNRALWSTQGNHDVNAYFDIFDLPAIGEAGGVASGTEDYYSFDVANVHLICLNSQDLSFCSNPESVMYQWLNADLLATTQPWIIAFWHHPAYSKGSHDSDNPLDSEGRMEDMRTIALPILEAGGVDLVLSGHSHSYERSKFINGHFGLSASFDPGTHVVQTGDGDPAGDGAYAKTGIDGAVYITAGSSGKIAGVTPHAAMQVWLNNLGSVIIDVDDDQMDVRFLRELTNPLQVDDGFQITKNLASDLDSPAPDPTTWESLPTPVDATSIAMTASTATDPSGVAYFFENVTDPTHNSGWQTSASYTDTGLGPDTTYTYRVKARDLSPAQNETAFSSAESASTDLTAPSPDPMSWAAAPTAVDSTSITMVATTASDPNGVEYLFENLTDPAHNSAWQTSASYTDTGLAPNTTYTYRVRARDLSLVLNETAVSSSESASTDLTAPSPDPMSWAAAPSAVDSTSITMVATTASDPSGVEYLFENLTDPDHNSTWQTSASYTDTGLAPNTSYSYRVRARDLSPAQNETAVSSSESATTDSPPDLTAPAPNPMTWATLPAAVDTTSISMTATTASDPSGVEYFFENVTDPTHNSGWQSSASYTDTSLAPSTSYTYRVKARDLSPAQNESAVSSSESATTDTPPDLTAPAPSPMTWATPPATVDAASIIMTATAASDPSGVEYFFENVTIQGHTSGWQASPTWTDSGLASGTSYSYQVSARDLSPAQNTTAPSSAASATTMNPQPVELFSDGFESGDLTTGDWISQNGNTAVKTGAAFAGLFGAELKNTTSMERSVDTTGYDTITISFARQTTAFDNGEVLVAEWSTGGGWNLIESTQSTTYELFGPIVLPSGTDDNTAFKIRFTTNANRNNEKGRIDEVRITGRPTSPPAAPGLATAPTPADGATSVIANAVLAWNAGSGAASHDVYFGTDPVLGAAELTGNQAATSFDPGTLDYNLTYYWRVDEVNATGTTTGTVWSFTTQGPPPAPASAPSPSDGATDVSPTATLSWTAGNGAASHDIYFGTVPIPGAGEFIVNQPATTFDPGALAFGTTYYWRVDEVNATGTTTGSVWSFATPPPPPAPASAPSPTDSSTNVSTMATLSWTAGGGVDNHNVYFGTNATPGESEFQGNQAATTFDPGALAFETTYYWRIDEINATGTTTGVVWSFTTSAPPPPPASAPSPADGATGVSATATLSWTAGSGAASHDIYFGTVPIPGASEFIVNQPATTFDPGALAFETTYYWRIDEVNASGTTTGSVWSFTTPPPPPAPASTPSPADGATGVSTAATLSWTAGSAAASHDIYFGTVPDPGPGEFITNQAATTFDPGPLVQGTTYYWRVEEVNANGTTAGTVWSFTTSPPPPAPAFAPSPADNATGVNASTILAWTAGSGAASHDVYFGTNAAPSASEFTGNQAAATFDPGTLASSTTYYWRIDEVNATATTTGPVWSFTTGAPSEPVSLFSDGFESADFTTGSWTIQNGDAKIKGPSASTGLYGAELKEASWIETTISTAGHHAVRLKYARRTDRLDAEEFLYAEWWDGSSWATLESTQDNTWAQKDLPLPATADDNSALKIRFRLSASDKREIAHLDDVELIGTPN